jgi:hypothetical protein
MFEKYIKNKNKKPVIIGGITGAMVGLPLILGSGAFYFFSQPSTQKTTRLFSQSPAELKVIYGNKRSRIYHLPECPNYNDILKRNRRDFGTMVEAEERRYRIAGNCPPDAIRQRRIVENAPDSVGDKNKRGKRRRRN